MTAALARQYADGSKADTAGGVNVANFLLGTGNLWDLIQTLGIGVGTITSGTTTLTQANAGLNLVDATSGNVTINLPAVSAAVTALFQFKRIDSSANTVTINRAGSDTIEGGSAGTSVALRAQYEVETLRNDGTSAWYRLGSMITPVGQCRLSKSGSNLLLSPYQGNKLTINGQHQVVPSAGITLAPTSLTANTTYYIYAYMSSGTMTLEASTTGHSTSSTTGVEIKTGDGTRTLVGMWRIETGPVWSSTAALGLNWFNRRPIANTGAFTADRTTTSASYVELNSEIRTAFLVWSGDSVSIEGNGSNFNGTASATTGTSVGIDGTTNEDTFNIQGSSVANVDFPWSLGLCKAGLAEGYHYVTLLGKTSGASTGTWRGNSAGSSTRATLGVMVTG